MKFLMVGKKYFRIKRGAYTVAKRFSEVFSDYFDFLDEREIRIRDSNIIRKNDSSILNSKYSKIIFTYQVPEQYKYIDLMNCVLNHKSENFMFYSSTLS